jgi:hypothetical protein
MIPFFMKPVQVVPAPSPLALMTLKVALDNILNTEISPIIQLVQVYDLVSVWQDQIRDGMITVSPDIKDAINALGREQYGQNRTKHGERVTYSSVFLGNVSGIFTLSVERILEGVRDDVLTRLEQQARGMLKHASELVTLL